MTKKPKKSTQSSPHSTPAPVATTVPYHPIVGIGASAGGLEAFRRLLSHLPDDTGMSFVLVQHLDPHHVTYMPELLAKCTTMLVQQVENGMPIAPNHVYFIPPNATLTVADGHLHIAEPSEPHGQRMAIDHFFESLAEDQQHNAICVILSGAGSDGTIGLKAIKEHGGMAIAQTPASARYDSMPRNAIMTGMVDHVIPIEEIPTKLVEYCHYLTEVRARKGAAGMREEMIDYLDEICTILQHRVGHDFSRYKRSTLTRRIQRRMQVLQINDVSDYLAQLSREDTEADALYKDLLIGMTHFFRDPEVFDALEQKIIPPIFERKIQDAEVRVWIPGCATGEEAYSVAMLMHDYMAEYGIWPHVQIFATDLDKQALETARRGLYSDGIIQQITPHRLNRYFSKQEHGYQIAKALRDMCIFSLHNLIDDPPFSRLDLISCRNLLIYLENDLQEKVLSIFHYALRPSGYLMLGASESTADQSILFNTLDRKHRLFTSNSTARRTDANLSLISKQRPKNIATSNRPRMTGKLKEILSQAVDQVLLERYTPACVLVNEQGDIIYFSGYTGKYLEHSAGMPSVNVIDMARKELRLEIRAALHQANKENQEIIHENLSIAVNDGLSLQRFNLIVRPAPEIDVDMRLFMIVFQEFGPPYNADNTKPSEAPSSADNELIAQYEKELSYTKEKLHVTVEELETSNEELKTSNEELLSSNEELQTSNEELQTSEEELQSINEELETLNTELRIKVEELDRANSDLHNLFRSTDIATLFLDSKLHIKNFTPAAVQMFRLIDNDIGRSILDIATRFNDKNLITDLKTVIKNASVKQREVQHSDDQRSFMLRILPYRHLDNVIEGAVITFVDITELKQTQEQLAQMLKRETEAKLRLVTDTVPALIAYVDDKERYQLNNKGYEIWHGIAREAMYGKTIKEVQGNTNYAMAKPYIDKALNGEQATFEATMTFKDGKTRRIEVNYQPHINEGGQIQGFFVLIHDISDRHYAAQLLREAKEAAEQADKLKTQFLTAASHDLRQPLQTLHMLNGILDKIVVDDKPRQTIAKQSAALKVMDQLLGTLLNISRLDSGGIKPDIKNFKINSILSQIKNNTEQQAAKKNLQLDISPCSYIVRSDPILLQEILQNLVSNAITYTPAGTVSVHCHDNGNELSIDVQDTGIGIEAQEQRAIFDEFYQLDNPSRDHRKGFGLGLAIVDRLARQLDHRISLQSALGEGSRFTVIVPLDHSAHMLNHAPPAQAALMSETQAQTIAAQLLLIDDNPAVIESICEFLTLDGYQITTATHGTEALQKARATTQAFDLIISDYLLPGEDNGFDLIQKLRQQFDATIPAILLTGDTSAEKKKTADAIGCQMLSKPILPNKLTVLIRQLLN